MAQVTMAIEGAATKAAATMPADQRATLVALMLIHKALELFSDDETTRTAELRSPFNADCPIVLVAKPLDHNGVKVPAVLFARVIENAPETPAEYAFFATLVVDADIRPILLHGPESGLPGEVVEIVRELDSIIEKAGGKSLVSSND